MNCSSQGPLSRGFSRQEYWSGLPCPPPGDLPKPGVKPRSSALQVDSLPFEQPGKPKEYWSGYPVPLQGLFPTQESNWGLLHCRQSLYQLNYQGSPIKSILTRFWFFKIKTDEKGGKSYFTISFH